MKRNWQDTAEFICGLWLCCSPFVLGFTDYKIATIAIVAFGIIILLFGEGGYFLPKLFEEVSTFVIGAALIAVPWVFGFESEVVPTGNAAVMGLILIAIAVSARIRDMNFARKGETSAKGV